MSRKSDKEAEQSISGYKEQKYKGKSFDFLPFIEFKFRIFQMSIPLTVVGTSNAATGSYQISPPTQKLWT